MKILVIGAGKMGSWLAGELAKEHEVAVFDTDKTRKVEKTVALATLEDVMNFNPGLLVNAASLQNTIAAFEDVTKYLPPNCIISDVASIKGQLPEYYAKGKHRFASVHPMFGPTFASLENLKKENAVIIKEGDEWAKNFFRQFFSSLGTKIFEYSFKEHDKMMAYSLTTPFTSSLVFAACMDNTAVPGTTFARHREIARGLLSEDNHLLAEVLFNPESISQLEKITSRLEFLKHVIKARDTEEIKRFLDKLRKNME